MQESPQDRIHGWLLQGDSSIRWQTMQDLLDEAPQVVAVERARVAQEGWGRQLTDGSWDDIHDVGHKEFHTTIALLEGLLDYAEQVPDAPGVEGMMAAGREFLLTHRLFKSEGSDGPIDPAFTRFSFPPRWHYDVLLQNPHPARTWFDLEANSQPSRWNTLRAQRVLRAYPRDRSRYTASPNNAR